jgi:putative DNA primase/helicase
MTAHIMPEKTVLAAALDYAELGIPVFPCSPDDKKPLTERGFKDASADPEIIRAWWRSHPKAMIGVPTGEPSGVFVLDVDQDETKGLDGEASLMDLLNREGSLSDTAIQITPRGGRHFLFRHPGGKVKNSASKLGAGLDIRGDGGYIIIAPSVNATGKAYEWQRGLQELAEAPDWLLNCLAPSAAAPRQDNGANVYKLNPDTRRSNYVDAAVRAEAQAVEQARQGQRNHRLNGAAFNLGQFVGAGELSEAEVVRVLINAATHAGLVADDGEESVRKTIASGMIAGKAQPRRAPEPQPQQRRREPQRTKTTRIEVGANALGDFDPTEDGISLAFEARFKDVLRYCHHAGCWYHWDGARWRKEETKLAFSFARQVCREWNRHNTDKLAKASTAAAVERFAQAARCFAVTSSTWDADTFLMGTLGGTVDLRTGDLHPARQEAHITKITSATPAPAGTAHPLWTKFLDEATNGDRELIRFLRQIAGYALTGDTREHALFFVYGPGGNGKSVFLNALTNILGDYAKTAAMDTFTASKGDKHPTELAMLKGARLVSVSETEEGRAWAESRIKSLTGGDPISARFMRQDFFTFLPTFKLLIVGNHKPVLHNVDEAARRRFNIIPFIQKPTAPDRQLEQKLRAEYPAILRWMIEGCLDWQKNGLIRPIVVTEATAEYFSEQDSVPHWLEECCETGGRNIADTTANLFASWSAWAAASGERPGSAKSFNQVLQAQGFEPVRETPGHRGKRGFLRVSVKPRDTSDQWQNRPEGS